MYIPSNQLKKKQAAKGISYLTPPPQHWTCTQKEEKIYVYYTPYFLKRRGRIYQVDIKQASNVIS